MAHVRKQMITFFMTTRCNLDCVYCYTPKMLNVRSVHQAIDFEFVKRGIDDFFRDNASRHIRFYGVGEPTLELDLMEQIRRYAHERAGVKLTVELQTNGFFGEQVARWIAERVDVLWISCDGPAEVHDAQRRARSGTGTSRVVEEHLRRFAANSSKQVGARVTLTSRMLRRQLELVDYFHGLGVRFVNVLPAFAPVEGSAAGVFDWSPLEFAEHFLGAHLRARERGIWYNTMCIANFDEPTRHGCRACTPCPHLTTDGYVTCCDFAQLGPEYLPGPLQQLVYGKWDPESRIIRYDEGAVSKVRARCVENLLETSCKGCEFAYNCAGGCLGQVVNETGDLLGRCEDNCIIVRYLGKRLQRNGRLHPALHS